MENLEVLRAVEALRLHAGRMTNWVEVWHTINQLNYQISHRELLIASSQKRKSSFLFIYVTVQFSS
jgi:hypothetical protein